MPDRNTETLLVRTLLTVIASLCVLAFVPARAGAADTVSPFAQLVGRWTGEGMLGFKASPPEKVKCRATYFLNDARDEVKQTIRCVTSAGGVEIVSNVKKEPEGLSGHWKETMHNLEGDLKGEITPKGFHIVVRGADMTANMEIIGKGDKQVVEIQFINTSLIGLTLVITKG